MTAIPHPHQPAGGSSDLGGSLAEQVARLAASVRALNRRIDRNEDTVVEAIQSLTTELDTLRDELDGPDSPTGGAHDGAAVDGQAEPPPVPRRWAARATREDWDQLIDWVDTLQASYSLQAGYTVPPCWPGHPGVVEQLAALHRAWVDAVLADAEAGPHGSSALAAWHDRWLWPTLQRFKTGTHYLIANCRQRHTPESTRTAPATDRNYRPAASIPNPRTTPFTDVELAAGSRATQQS